MRPRRCPSLEGTGREQAPLADSFDEDLAADAIATVAFAASRVP